MQGHHSIDGVGNVKFTGRTISSGKAEGNVLKLSEPLSFLGGVDGSTGELRVGNGGNVADRILIFPQGKGSTVGSFVMYDLMVHGKAPAAVVNESAETIVATGAVISSIPMIDSIPSIDIFEDGEFVRIDADEGSVEIPGIESYREVASSVIMLNGRVLMLKRPKRCRSFPGKWSLVAGKIEEGETPSAAARREIMEETGLEVKSPDAVMRPFYVREGKYLWKVFPFLFRVAYAEPVINEENETFEWKLPEEVSTLDTVTDSRKVIEYLMKQ